MANFYDDDNFNENESLQDKEEIVESNETLSESSDNLMAVDESQNIDSADTESEATAQENETEKDSLVETSPAQSDSDNVSTDEDKKDEDKPEKQKKGINLSKKTKIIISVTVAATVLVLLLGVMLPILLYHAPRIFVKTADDFVAGDKVGAVGKYFYSLDKDISCDTLTIQDGNVYSIDMNKHDITVTGDFSIICNEERTGTLYIGTRKNDTTYNNKKATLKAKNIIVNAPNLDVVIAADVVAEKIDVTAKSFTVANAKNGEYAKLDMNITAQSVKFNGTVSAPKGSAINITECANVVVNKNVKIENTVNLFTSSAISALEGSNISTLNLDETSTASIAGTVGVVKGGKQVVMELGHNCNTYSDINTLVIFRDSNTGSTIKNCKSVIWVEKLPQPLDINIEELNGKIYCVVSTVQYATGYNYYINDVLVSEANTSTKLDITDFVKEAGKYNVKVVPVGNYVSGMDLSEQGSGTMYINGDAISTDYNCVFTLQAPQNLKVTKQDGSYILSFDAVMHAETYKILVDGKEIKRADASANTEDITQYLTEVGNHSVRVQALNSNPNIHSSTESMTSCSVTASLEAVTGVTAELQDENHAISVKWQGVVNGYEYEISLQVNGAEVKVVGRTSIINEDGSVAFVINLEDLGIEYSSSDSYKISVKAVGHDYYTDSVIAYVTLGANA